MEQHKLKAHIERVIQRIELAQHTVAALRNRLAVLMEHTARQAVASRLAELVEHKLVATQVIVVVRCVLVEEQIIVVGRYVLVEEP